MNKKKAIVAGVIAVLAVALCATASSLVWVCRKVRAFESSHGGSVYANLSRAEMDEKVRAEIAAAADTNGVRGASAAQTAGEKDAEMPPQMEVVRVEYDGERTLRVCLSERPDMDVVRHYVSVDPEPAGGGLSFSYSTRYSSAISGYEPILGIVGDFAFRTNLTLRIRRGLPLYGKGANLSAQGSLRADYVHAFRRRDARPTVNYAANGRYLPPGGARAIGVESVNVTNVHARICRVEPRNVVQLLAREEGEYRRYEWSRNVDNEETEELSGEAEETDFSCVNRPNEKETHALPVAMKDGGSANGIYLVAVWNADRRRADGWWCDRDDQNPARYRLVCLSDLALSVRMNGTDSPGVWVTSLMKGVPVDGARITVYSKSNTKIMEGETDENGWCRPVRVAKGEPFAVVAESAEGDDGTFLAIRPSMEVDETYADGARPDYLEPGQVEAFLWTERGIYRHDERIMLHAIVRDGKRRAPAPFPVELCLVSPKGDVFSRLARRTDGTGSLVVDTFKVPAEQPSGTWTLRAKIPGKDGRVLGEREIKVEEFAPPQIRVKVAAETTAHPSNFAFSVSAEHLFGGPAHALACEGAVVFTDIPFAPAKWKGWRFGNSGRALKPSFREVGKTQLDRDGKCRFDAPLWADTGLPAAAVRATAQGVVFEDGGRPATARATCDLHYYPFYIGSTLAESVRLEPGVRPKIRVACVRPDGTRLAEPRRLVGKLERIDTVYSYRTQPNGWQTWDCTHVRTAVAENIPVVTSADDDTTVELPTDVCGDYAFEVTDPETLASFGMTFYLSDWADETVRAPMSDPTAVTLVPDKTFYRVGETPRLSVRAPFAGWALVSVLREKDAYTDILALTNATSEIALRPVTAENAPSLDVFVSVVQSVEANAKHLAVRAHGLATIAVRPAEEEVPVSVERSEAVFGASASGAEIRVAFAAPGATSAIVTVVDEGINLLTDERVPDPVSCFAAPRNAVKPLYDIYHRVLPVLGEDRLRVGGVKTGGGAGAEMLGRVSPVPTRRFKPLAMWSAPLAVGADGKGEWKAQLPEFVGEVRVTVVAWSDSASGAASAQTKVTPKIVTMPDAPRFVAPGDVFEVSLPIYNKSQESGNPAMTGGSGVSPLQEKEGPSLDEKRRDAASPSQESKDEKRRDAASPSQESKSSACEVTYSITAGGKEVVAGKVALGVDGHTNVVARITAPDEPGELDLVYHVRGMGEVHDQTIHLPVRPAVAWVETAGVRRVEDSVPPEARRESAPFERYSEKVYDSPAGEYESALRWLAEYRHGCLEQTSSRVFPLLGAGGLLASFSPAGPDAVAAGVRRVESMVRSTDFVMWPDCNYAPWDPEVSLYAAHFLVEAERVGYTLNRVAKERVGGFLKRWAMSTNDTVSAYACHTLALARRPEKDRMLRLYDASTNLTLLSRARLARAFAMSGDRRRASALLAANVAPSSVKDAAFSVLALLEIDPDDARILPLVENLNSRRDRARFCWGTTGDNAHALLAIGSYFRHHPAKAGEKFVSWRRLSLPKPGEVKDESSGISVERRFLKPEGGEADVSNLARGEMLVVELALKTDDDRVLSDLVVEDLFPACFEPVHGSIALAQATSQWVMRSDARDDRMLVFSKRFRLARGEEATFRYPVRVVSCGEYVLPGPSVEAMYHPELHARRAPSRISVRK